MEISPIQNLAVYAQLAEFPLDVPGLASELPQWKPIAASLRELMALLGVSSAEMHKKQNALPVPDRYGAEKGWRPRKVSMSAIYGWINGKDPWPAFRLAAAVAMLEVRTLQYAIMLEAKAKPDPLEEKRIELAQIHHKRLGSEPSLSRWLSLHRLAIHAQLKRNRRKSAKHKILFDKYDSLMPPEVLRAIAKHTPESERL
jgi:hypothetical protein